MKFYNNLDNFREREHVIEITIQSGEYKGILRSKPISGNCFGIDILTCADEYLIYDIADYERINCEVELIGEDDDGQEWCRYTLTNDEGEECESEEECRYFGRLIVGINIVECTLVEDKKGY